MTPKQFVKSKHPTAKAEKQTQGRIKGMKKTYYLIRERGAYMYMASGDTESKAWAEAKQLIIDREERQKVEG